MSPVAFTTTPLMLLTPLTIPRLPQEVIDLIIDELSVLPEDDSAGKALEACSTTSSAFRHRCQRHLFRHVKITPVNHAFVLAGLHATSPRIRGYVQKFSLHLQSDSELIKPSYLPTHALPPLPNIYKLSLWLQRREPRPVMWATLNNPFRSWVRSLLCGPALTRLTLFGIDDLPTAVFLPCVRLKVLRVTNCRFVDFNTNDVLPVLDTPTYAENPQTKPALHSFSCDSFVPGLTNYLDLTRLADLVAGIPDDATFSQCQAIANYSSLESLNIPWIVGAHLVGKKSAQSLLGNLVFIVYHLVTGRTLGLQNLAHLRDSPSPSPASRILHSRLSKYHTRYVTKSVATDTHIIAIMPLRKAGASVAR